MWEKVTKQSLNQFFKSHKRKMIKGCLQSQETLHYFSYVNVEPVITGMAKNGKEKKIDRVNPQLSRSSHSLYLE